MSIQRGGLQALRYTQNHRWQLRHPGGATGEDMVLKPMGGERTGRERERPVAVLMLLSTVGYLQKDGEGRTVVT